MKAFRTFVRMFIFAILLFLLIGCSAKKPPTPQDSNLPEILAEPVTQMEFSTFPIRKPVEIPVYDPTNFDAFQVDLRFADISGLDLRDCADSLFHSAFSTATIWPDALPEGFDPELMLEYGRDPGLGLRELHERGYTGRGVSIAIIDQTLGTAHPEYGSRLAYYESTGGVPYASMHGCAVASLAVGQNVGVAPEAKLYFFAPSWMDENGTLTFSGIAEAIDRIVEINVLLPENERIRSVSIARGIRGEESVNGYDEAMNAIDRAEEAGVFVITTSMDSLGFKFTGLERDPLSDTNDLGGYSLPYWWTEAPPQTVLSDMVGFPMGSRTYAGWTGPDMYEFSVFGGYSWTVPYINGLYAIAVQVDPDIDPQEFWDLLTETAQRANIEFKGVQVELSVANPSALIKAIEGRLN